MMFHACWPFTGLALPIDFLDVFVHLLGQVVATLGAAPLDYIPTAFRGHAFPKTVDTRPTTNFWLISSFWHDLRTSMHYSSFKI